METYHYVGLDVHKKMIAYCIKAQDGRVLRQEVELPILGRLTLRDEAFDEAAYKAAKQYPRRIQVQEDDE